MAKIKDGLLSGKIGNMVASSYNGKAYMRRAPHRTAPATEGELKSRYIFMMVNAWAKPLNPVFKVGFNEISDRMPAIQAGISMIHKEALHRDGYDSFIAPALVKISSGTLGLPATIEVALQGEDLVFNWDIAIDEQKDPRDRIMLLAYNPQTSEAVYNLSGPKRYTGIAELSLSGKSPGIYHIYIAFLAADGSRQSMSRHVAMINKH